MENFEVLLFRLCEYEDVVQVAVAIGSDALRSISYGTRYVPLLFLNIGTRSVPVPEILKWN